MHDWRERGYVADSDEEDIITNNESQPRSVLGRAERSIVTNVASHSQELGEHDGHGSGVEVDGLEVKEVAKATKAHDTAIRSPSSKHANEKEDWADRNGSKPLRTYGRRTTHLEEVNESAVIDAAQTRLDDLFSSNPAEAQHDETHRTVPNEDEGTTDQTYAAPFQLTRSPNTVGSDLSNFNSSPAVYLGTHALRHGSETITEQLRSDSIPPEASRVSSIEIEDQTRDYRLRDAAPIRHFRSRKPVQLHPYMVERETYKRSWKARGIVPVRILGPQAEAPNATQREGETQDAYNSDGSQGSVSSGLSSPPLSVNNDVFASFVEQDPDEDEFPDVERVLNRVGSGLFQSNGKRQRLNKTPSATNAMSRISHASINRSVSNSHPPTPPTTDSAPSSVNNDKTQETRFRLPKGLTKASLITPNASSPSRHTISTTKSTNSTNPILNISSSSGSDSEQSASSSEADAQFRTVQKRIKGVLPASWIRLDNHQRKAASPKKRSGLAERTTSDIMAPIKGVAQRKLGYSSTPRSVVRSVIDPSFYSDDSDVELSTHSPTMRGDPTVEMRQTKLNGPAVVEVDIDSDEMEDNAIDPMFPSTSRPRHQRNRSRKRQTKLVEAFHRSHDIVSSRRRDDRPKDKAASRPSDRATKQRPKQTRPIRQRAQSLSILDAPASPANSAREIPHFVRLATRQARKRQDHGRQSPSRKVIRLATKPDTEDAISTLTSWHTGKLQRQKTTSQHSPRKQPKPSKLTPTTDFTGRATTQYVGIQELFGTGPIRTRASVSSSLLHSIQENTTIAALGSETRQATRPKTHTPNATIRSRRAPSGLSGAKTDGNLLRLAHSRRMLEGTSMQATARERDLFRSGQLEMEGRQFDLGGRRIPHLYKSVALQQVLTRGQALPTVNLPLERFLNDPEDVDAPEMGQDVPESDHVHVTAVPRRSKHQTRKPAARRLDVETTVYRQPAEPLPPPVYTIQPESEASNAIIQLRGLGNLGTRYSTDFDVWPLEVGTYFHEITFIGSGDFDAVLLLAERDLDGRAGHITIDCGETSLLWSTWSEEVSNGLTKIQQVCQEALNAVFGATQDEPGRMVMRGASDSMLYMLRSVVRYCSGCLSFSDPVDRESCLLQLDRFIEDCTDMLCDAGTVESVARRPQKVTDGILDALLYLACLSMQALTISGHDTVSTTTRQRMSSRLLSVCRACTNLILPSGCARLRTLYEDMRQHTKREAGIRDDQIIVKAFVILHHISQGTSSFSFADMIRSTYIHHINEIDNVVAFDQIWYDLFTMQPLLEIDRRGVYRPGSRTSITYDNWSLVKSLLDRILSLYPASVALRKPSLNNYIRSNFARLHTLIRRWHWSNCEIILSTVYDFFATRGLSYLDGEESRGPPVFLDNLHQMELPDLDLRDNSFHIFLKLLVLGLRPMPQLYPTAKVKRIAWRFVPNHGRTYRKDEDVQRSHLDALQNHHDLLCTLIWSLPPGCRPRLESVRDLVDFNTSHQEACRINVNAWKQLARYVISRPQASEEIQSLALWYREMISAITAQYRLARSEAEEVLDAAKVFQTGPTSVEDMQIAASRNQRKILDTLQLAVVGMQEAMKVANSRLSLRNFLEQAQLLDIFKVFDASQPRTFGPILQTLVACRQYLQLSDQSSITHAEQEEQASEESQDYGDFEGLDAMLLDGESVPVQSRENTTSFIHSAISQLLSNVFGADQAVDDGLLACLVEVWCMLASQDTIMGGKPWSRYIDAYSSDSWFQLRQTDNLKKWTPFYMSKLLEIDAASIHGNEETFLTSWIVSLVERESMLKFQHLLTSAMLNIGHNEGLVQNPPFAKARDIDRFNISLAEFRVGRSSLIDCILSNMRSTLERAVVGAAESRRKYIRILKQVMSVMKNNYQEVSQTTSAVADTNAQGSYVTFVHHVISSMQQHTADICTIDNFFTDSAAFPLPRSDPKYVVGRIRSYVPKLADASGRKQLAIFIQTLCHRAVSENATETLVDQLLTAITADSNGVRSTITFRNVFLIAILPAYLQVLVTTPTAWLLIVPMLHTAVGVLATSWYHTNFSNLECAENELSILSGVLSCLIETLDASVKTANIGDLPGHVWKIIAAIISIAKPITNQIDFMMRTLGVGHAATQLLETMLSFTHYMQQVDSVCGVDAISRPDVQSARPNNSWKDTHDFCKREILDDLRRNWSVQNDHYFVMRGGIRQEVPVNLLSQEEEKQHALAMLQSYVEEFETVFGGNEKHSEGVDTGPDGLFV